MREQRTTEKGVFKEEKNVTLKGAYTEGRKLLEQAGIPEPDLDAWYLLEYVTGVRRASYYADPDREMTGAQQTRYESCLERRSRRVPLQHITGEQEFMGLNFHVNEHVLIPRQDTETLVEQALDLLSRGEIPVTEEDGQMRVLDMCTGSGCILLSVLHYAGHPLSAAGAGNGGRSASDAESRRVSGTGADLSEEALAVAERNAEALGIRAEFIRGDLFENIKERYGMILSNPPYIRSAEIDTLQEEVRLHDPREALDGKEDGLYFYRRIVGESRRYLLPGGYLIVEIGYDQAEDVSALMRCAGYTGIQVKKDLAGLDRVVYGRYS